MVIEEVVCEYLSKHRIVQTKTLYKALRVKTEYGLSLNKFRLTLNQMYKLGEIDNIPYNGLTGWRLK